MIVGFPGETDADVEELEQFLTAARLDVVGVFGYSDEDGTEAAGCRASSTRKRSPNGLPGSGLADELVTQRAEDRISETSRRLVESLAGRAVGTAAHQAPDVDGECVVLGDLDCKVGELLRCEVVDSAGVDLVVRPLDRPAVEPDVAT